MSRELLVEYATLKKTIEDATEKMELIKPEVLRMVQQDEKKRLNLKGFGMFSLVDKRRWKYTPTYTDMEARLKERQIEEETNGWATAEEYQIVMFKKEKIENAEA